jgi:hypothetical protein
MEAEVGMLVVETIAKIRRAYFVHGQPIKAICREPACADRRLCPLRQPQENHVMERTQLLLF